MQIHRGPRIAKTAQLMPGAATVLFDPNREKILLTRRRDNGQWCLPGGRMEPGESAAETAEREMREETGLEIRVTKLIGVYTDPDWAVSYASNPDKLFQIVAFCFEATLVGGTLRLSNETTEFGWFTPQQTRSMDLVAHHPQRIADALANQAGAFVR